MKYRKIDACRQMEIDNFKKQKVQLQIDDMDDLKNQIEKLKQKDTESESIDDQDDDSSLSSQHLRDIEKERQDILRQALSDENYEQSDEEANPDAINDMDKKSLELLMESKNQLIKLLNQNLSSLSSTFEDYEIIKQLLQQLIDLSNQFNKYHAFDLFLFSKLNILTEKKNPCVIIKVLNIFNLLFINGEFFIKIFSNLIKYDDSLKTLIDLVNYFLKTFEIFEFTLQGVQVKKNLLILTQFMLQQKDEKLSDEETLYLDFLLNKLDPQIQFEKDKRIEALLQNDNLSGSKLWEILSICGQILSNCSDINEQIIILCDSVYLAFEKIIKNLPDDDIQKVQYLHEMLNIIERFMFQTEYFITIEQNSLQETKPFFLNFQKKMIQSNESIFDICGYVLNSTLLIPFNSALQMRSLVLIRRIYCLFPQKRDLMYGPIIIALSNISLFSENLEEIKEAATFLYQLTNNENIKDKKLTKLLNEQDQNLIYLKQHKAYSVKALSFPQEIDHIYMINNLNLAVGYPNKTIVNCESGFNINLYVDQENSLINWRFQTIDYDIGFGIYKLSSIEPITIKNLDKPQSKLLAEPIIKIQRQDSHKRQIMVKSLTTLKGSVIASQKGLYQIIFDNTYSIWRQKTLYHNIFLFEKN